MMTRSISSTLIIKFDCELIEICRNWVLALEEHCVRLIRFSERVLQPSLPIQSNSHSSPITACPWGPSRGDFCRSWWCHDDCMLVSTICYYLRLFATFLCLTFAGFGHVMMCHVHFHVLPVKNKNGVLCIDSSTMVGHSPVDTEYLGGLLEKPWMIIGGTSLKNRASLTWNVHFNPCICCSL